MKQFILENLTIIFSTLFGSGSFYAYWTERGKRKAEEKTANSDALKSMQDAYDKFTEDSLIRYNALKDEVTDLSKKVKELTEQLNREKVLYTELEKTYNAVKKEYEALKIKYESLEKEFESIKKKKK